MSLELDWIIKGYTTFAHDGPGGLKVERLARSVGKNKSSFYHHFADLEVFTSQLLDYHEAQAKILAEKEAASKNEEELCDAVLEHKLDLLFNRQLRIHRDNEEFKKCFDQISAFAVPSMLPAWKKVIGLSENTYLAEMVLMLSLENFFLQITDETLTRPWLRAYFEKIRAMIAQFKKSRVITLLDGSV